MRGLLIAGAAVAVAALAGSVSHADAHKLRINTGPVSMTASTDDGRWTVNVFVDSNRLGGCADKRRVRLFERKDGSNRLIAGGVTRVPYRLAGFTFVSLDAGPVRTARFFARAPRKFFKNNNRHKHFCAVRKSRIQQFG